MRQARKAKHETRERDAHHGGPGKPGRTGGALRVVNRVLLGLIGLVLLLAGGVVVAQGQDWAVPGWWPYSGPHDVLLTRHNRQRYRDDGWWWPVVIAALAVIVVVTLCWALAQFRRARLAEILIDSGDGEGALLRGRALEGVLESEARSLDGVARARARLTGRRTAPAARVQLLLEPHADPGGAMDRLTGEALAHARGSAGLEALPAEVRLRAAKHRPERVN
ncbi:alkaline shock response membrane anchor protein AmaP [Streptomyces liangshanensis]|uniref:Alkaline shock response membrane anchor protein AmaP n=1 Tax=Streptomyces liangshanensis TaxID=2717324 RepID=A0A6G9H9E5_9ACTN|nr:alkaline shock response membrane anchor protein AmaP [Streptomyces liangshanensis]